MYKEYQTNYQAADQKKFQKKLKKNIYIFKGVWGLTLRPSM